MLFDLRGRGRRRVVQVIYLTLAVLMGGGLVLFGIGGDVQGGLFDAFSENGGSGAGQIERRVEQAEERVQANPRDAGAYAQLALQRYQLAGQSDGYDPSSGAFTGEAAERLSAATQAWERHVALAGDRPDVRVAQQMTNAYVSLNQPAQAARAQNLVVDADDDPSFGELAKLAQLQYAAGNSRQGDLASSAAVRAAPSARRQEVRQALEQVKTQALQQQAQQTGGGASGGQGAPGGAPGAAAPATPAPAP